MKKLLSLLLALTFVLSMGIMSFAADETTTAAAETTTKSAEVQVSEGLDKVAKDVKDYFSGPKFEKIVTDLKDAVARVAGDPEQMAVMADEAVAKISEATGMNIEDVQKAIADSGLFDGFAKLYMPAVPQTTVAKTEAPTVPATGSAVGGLAIFATLSIAAAAAFVCKKK